MAANLSNFIPGIVVGGECCCKGCKESDCEKETCGCADTESCQNETACARGLCEDGVTACSCCDAGYAKTSQDANAQCVYLLDSCPTTCGDSTDCTSGWSACGCQRTEIECTAFENDGSGYNPGVKYQYYRTAQQNTTCIPSADSPTQSKGMVSGQTRKSCCGSCNTNIWCPQDPGSGGGGGGGPYDICESLCAGNRDGCSYWNPVTESMEGGCGDYARCYDYQPHPSCVCFACTDPTPTYGGGCFIDDDYCIRHGALFVDRGRPCECYYPPPPDA